MDFSTLKMEAIRSSETSVNARSTQRHIPEDDILLTHCVCFEKSMKELDARLVTHYDQQLQIDKVTEL
jgi:hypothetical protein